MNLSTIVSNLNKGLDTQEFQVFMDLKSIISVKCVAESHAEAVAYTNFNLDPVGIQQAFISFLKMNGVVVTPDVHDVNIKLTAVYGEDES